MNRSLILKLGSNAFGANAAALALSLTFCLVALAACATDMTPIPTPALHVTPTTLPTGPAAPVSTLLAQSLPTNTRLPDTPASLDSTPALVSPQSPAPTGIPTRYPAPTTAGPVRVYNSSVTFAAYPYASFLQPRMDAALNFPFSALAQKAYAGAAGSRPLTTRIVPAVILENSYLRLTFLPELGGRLFQLTFKPTNQNLLYNNHVLKPTEWGPVQQGGWMAVGGMEWAFPVNEHGYEWDIPWQYQVVPGAGGMTIVLTDSQAQDRVRVRVSVTLPDDAAYIVVQPEITNPTTSPQRVQFWINAQLAPGGQKNVSPHTEFTLPTDRVLVHSTGDSFIPAVSVPANQATASAPPLAWPVVGGRDLSRYSGWDDYLGLFAPQLAQPFVAVYNHDTQLGLARVFPPEQAPGVKLFAFGPRFCCRSEFADDGSDYVELWGGLPRTFFPSDDVTLAPGETRAWDEWWAPFAGMGGITTATREVMLFVAANHDVTQVSAYATMPLDGVLVLLADGNEIKRWNVTLTPGAHFDATAASPLGHLQLRWLADNGTVLAATP